MHKKAASRHTVAVVVDDGVSPFEFSVACEVFGLDRSELAGKPWYRFRVCGAHRGPIRTLAPFELLAPFGLEGIADADTVVVPPLADGPVRDDVLVALRSARRRGARLISLCTGAFVLAEAGLLDGRPATTHWASTDELRRRYPDVLVDRDVLYVDDGDVLTSAGSAASMDLCLHVVRRDFGAEVANEVARRCVVAPHRDGGQAQFVKEPLGAFVGPDPFSESLAWVEAHLDEETTVGDLARRAAMSPRSYARRFRSTTGTTPRRWLISQRVLLAQRLLETTDEPIEEVARRCGMGTAANLRLHFAERVRSSPLAYRRTFRHEGG